MSLSVPSVECLVRQMANHIAMNAWRHTFNGALGTYLYDSFGWDIFSLNFSEDFANLFKGLRVDSGDNREELRKICDKYKSLNIDSRTKQVIFSNALTTDEAIEIQDYASKVCQPSFGIGTHFTNDFPHIEPMNTVIKLTSLPRSQSRGRSTTTRVRSQRTTASIPANRRSSSVSWRPFTLKETSK